MKRLAALLAVLALSAGAAHATDAVSLGYSDNTTVINSGTDDCSWGTLYVNHDGSFENGYDWRYGGVVVPYYGALGEGYNLGYGCIACGAFWLTTLPGWYFGQSADLYVWAGGAGSGVPGAVLEMVPHIVFANVPNWPTLAQNDVNMLIDVSGEFTIGFWGDWPGLANGYFIGADQNGFGGHPWTNIAPGIGYPTGWNDPSIVWGPTQSLGIGAWFVAGQSCGPCCGHDPAEAPTWGSIKTMFK
jgi:hypothetical protein